jgi:(2S)-methylsuccinyl-CoA dehydrogenase
MQGFENGRLQTAARAVGVMQAAYEAAFAYATDRTVFGRAHWRVSGRPNRTGRTR